MGIHRGWKLGLLYVLNECKYFHCFSCRLEILLSTIDPNLNRTWIVVKMRHTLRNPLLLVRNKTVLAIQDLYGQNSFHLQIQWFWVWVSSLSWERNELLKIWVNLKFKNFPKIARSIVVSRSISNSLEHSDLLNISTSYHFVSGC